MTKPLPRPTLIATLSTIAMLMPGLALAHAGHGLDGSHWHATDVLGLVAIAGIFGAAVWWARRK